MDTEVGRLRASLSRAIEHPQHLLLPATVIAAAAGLATTLQTVVHAWTAPAMLLDGRFTFAEGSTAATVTAVVVAVLIVVATTATGSLISLLAAAHELERGPRLRPALAEVRRRWALVLGFSGLLAVALVAGFAVAVLALSRLPIPGALLVIVAAFLALLAGGAVVGRVLPVALVSGLGPLRAWRLIRTQRRNAFAAGYYAATVRLTVVVMLLGTGINWLVSRLPESLGQPTLDAADALAQTVTTSFAFAAIAVGMAVAHVRATERVAGTREDDLDWPGLDRVAPRVVEPPVATDTDPDADTPTDPDDADALPSFWNQPLPTSGEEATRRRRAGQARWWVAVVGGWVAAPLALVAVVATNPTPAIEPVVAEFGATIVDPLIAPYGDGVAVVSHERLTVCTPDDGCTTDQPFADFAQTSIVQDAAGTGIAIIGDDHSDFENREYVLLTCDPRSCDPTQGTGATRAALPGRAVLSYQHSLHALAVRDGLYAVIHPSGDAGVEELAVTWCTTPGCEQPHSTELGRVLPGDVVRAAFAPDGTLWVLQTTAERDTLRLRSLAADAQTPADALTVDLPSTDDGYFYLATPGGYPRPPVIELAVRDDGTPVVLHRDTTDGAIVLTSCEDAACTSATSARLPFDPTTTWSAQLAVDATGRPLVATAGNGIQLHSCTDRSCTSVRSGLVSVGYPESFGSDTGAAPFMVLDDEGRPAFVMASSFPFVEARFCQERRCGL